MTMPTDDELLAIASKTAGAHWFDHAHVLRFARAAIAAHVPEAGCGNIAAVPAQPVAYTVAGEVTNWARDFSKYRTQHYVRPVYAAPQAVPVPAGWVLVPVEPTEDMLFSAEMSKVRGYRDLYNAMLAAAPKEQPHE